MTSPVITPGCWCQGRAEVRPGSQLTAQGPCLDKSDKWSSRAGLRQSWDGTQGWSQPKAVPTDRRSATASLLGAWEPLLRPLLDCSVKDTTAPSLSWPWAPAAESTRGGDGLWANPVILKDPKPMLSAWVPWVSWWVGILSAPQEWDVNYRGCFLLFARKNMFLKVIVFLLTLGSTWDHFGMFSNRLHALLFIVL